MSEIKDICGREILDSRGNPTVACEVTLASGKKGCSCVPSGASTGAFEAVELRDNDKNRYSGLGVLKAVANINERIKSSLCFKESTQQAEIDQIMIDLDGTGNKANLGANAILAVSLAVARASANEADLPLYIYLNRLSGANDNVFTIPLPMMNILNGGVHGDNNIDIQEFMILPTGALNIREAIRFGAEVFHSLKRVLKQRKLNTNVGDEGGFAPNLNTNQQALDVIIEAIEQAGFVINKDIHLSLDIASSEFYRDGKYNLASEGKLLESSEFINYQALLAENYSLFSIEDGMAEDDWEGWQKLTSMIGSKVKLIGDDLFVTNQKRLQKGITEKAGNAILIKLNQIGTLSETLATIKLAKDNGFDSVISHRSGETEDTFIADLAVATNVGFIKTGSLSRSDRVCKYNRLLRIFDELGYFALFPNLK